MGSSRGESIISWVKYAHVISIECSKDGASIVLQRSITVCIIALVMCNNSSEAIIGWVKDTYTCSIGRSEDNSTTIQKRRTTTRNIVLVVCCRSCEAIIIRLAQITNLLKCIPGLPSKIATELSELSSSNNPQ